MEMKVFEYNRKFCIDSREAAKLLEVRHGNLTMLIRKLIGNNEELKTEFMDVTENSRLTCICMTEKGCSAVVNYKLNNAKANKPATEKFALACEEAFGHKMQVSDSLSDTETAEQTVSVSEESVESVQSETDDNTIEIDGIKIYVKEYKNQRVVTFRDIDAVHHRPEGTARKRFYDNKRHFIEGEDYFKLKLSEVCPLNGQALTKQGFNPNADVIAVTESGYYMLVKVFTDDLSWDVQRKLKKGYFLARQIIQQANVPDSYMIEDKVERAKRWIQEEEERRALQLQVNEQVKQLEMKDEQIAEMKPKADYCEDVLLAEGYVTPTVIAKDYGQSARWLNEYLHKKKIQFKQDGTWYLYAKYAKMGYAMTKTTVRPDKNGINRTYIHTYWNQKGRMFIYEILKADGIYPVSEQDGQLALVTA